MKRCTLFVLIALLLTAGLTFAAAKDAAPAEAPNATGQWTGLWGAFNPATQTVIEKDDCKLIEANVTVKDGIWHATFAGECSRPYKYEITMTGRQVGKAIMFKGTVDLGPKDGGVYDWVGRATDTEFVGFYTSAHYTGVFQMSRAAAE